MQASRVKRLKQSAEQGMKGEEEEGRMKKEELKPDKLIKGRAAVWQMMHGAGCIDLTAHKEGVWAGRCMEKCVCMSFCVCAGAGLRNTQVPQL